MKIFTYYYKKKDPLNTGLRESFYLYQNNLIKGYLF
jgi:hypothetical protein